MRAGDAAYPSTQAGSLPNSTPAAPILARVLSNEPANEHGPNSLGIRCVPESYSRNADHDVQGNAQADAASGMHVENLVNCPESSHKNEVFLPKKLISVPSGVSEFEKAISLDATAAIQQSSLGINEIFSNVHSLKLEKLHYAASSMTSSSIEKASLSIASNLVMQAGAGSSAQNVKDDSSTKPNAEGLLACRLPQPPDGRWLGCGQGAHAPVPCLVWKQKGLTHSNQIHDQIFAFTSTHYFNNTASLRCSMPQPPLPSHAGPLVEGCGQLSHPDRVCGSWISAGVLTHLEAKQKLLEWRRSASSYDNSKTGVRVGMRKLPDKDRCIVPQPPDGSKRGCLAVNHHRDAVCESWKGLGVTSFSAIRPRLLEWHNIHPDPDRKLCFFFQPPDGAHRGCGAPHHKGKICASWAEIDVLTRQEAVKAVRLSRAENKPKKAVKPRSDAEKLCNLPQPPDGRVIGCGASFHRMAVCDSWSAFGVPNREGVKAYIDKYRVDYCITGAQARVCRALQPPDGRVKGCGLGWHRGACPSWKAIGLTDRKAIMEHIQSSAEAGISVKSETDNGAGLISRRISFSGISRRQEFPESADDPDTSVQYFLEGDFDRSIQELTKRIQQHPDRALLYNNRGVVYAERGWTDLAIRDWSKSLDLDPNYSDVFANRGLVRVSVAKPVLASDDCRKAISSSQGLCSELVRLSLAMALYESGDFAGCCDECRRILEISSSNFRARCLMGLANGALRQFDKAAECFQQCLHSNIDNERISSLLNIAKDQIGSGCQSASTKRVSDSTTDDNGDETMTMADENENESDAHDVDVEDSSDDDDVDGHDDDTESDDNSDEDS